MKKTDSSRKASPIALMALAAGAFGVWQLFGAVNGFAASSCSPGDSMAAVMARKTVARELKAPSTAAFGPTTSDYVTDTGECAYRVTGHVDAQNSFGAVVRQSYTVEMRRDPDANTWSGALVAIN